MLIILEEMERKYSDRQKCKRDKSLYTITGIWKNASKSDKPRNGSVGILFVMWNGVIHEIDKITKSGFLGGVRWVEEGTSVLYYKPFICS